MPRSPPPTRPKPDVRRMERAVRSFLEAAGLPPSEAHLDGTPERVAKTWIEEFLDGYQATPSDVLKESFLAPAGARSELVVVSDLRFHSMCPHHLMPYEGTAHIAYVPGKRVVGFGRIAELLNVLAHRLVLQEELARNVATAIATELRCAGAACIIEAKQSCLRLRGGKQRDAITHAEAYEGRLQADAALRAQLWAQLGSRR